MNRAVLIATIVTSSGIGMLNAQQARPAVAENPQAVRRTYPGLRTLPGVPATNAPASNVPGSDPLTNNAPVYRVGPNGEFISEPARASKVTPLQLENINRLELDLRGLELAARDPSQQAQLLTRTLQAAPVTKVKPTTESISQLATTLAKVFPALRLTPIQRRQLAIDVNMAINSANLSSTEAQRVLADANTLLEPSRLANVPGVDQLSGELKGIVDDVQSRLAQHPDANKSIPTKDVGQSGGSESGGASGKSPQP